jgi:hypothetical protein
MDDFLLSFAHILVGLREMDVLVTWMASQEQNVLPMSMRVEDKVKLVHLLLAENARLSAIQK